MNGVPIHHCIRLHEGSAIFQHVLTGIKENLAEALKIQLIECIQSKITVVSLRGFLVTRRYTDWLTRTVKRCHVIFAPVSESSLR